MYLVEIAERTVHLELSPEDCDLLMRVLKHAIETDIQPISLHHWVLTAAVAFEAMALAAGVYSKGAEGEEFTIFDLRAGKVIDRIA